MQPTQSPLADRIRPKTLDEMVGQTHLIGPSAPVRLIVEKKQLHSIIFWGPPGCGKTTLAKIIAAEIGARFHFLSAVSAGKDDIRQIIQQAKENTNNQQAIQFNQPASNNKKNILVSVSLVKNVLFLDEIHRFNKAQQDYLLPYVEDGTITLIGATTENPSFEVIPPLLSRCQVFVLTELTPNEVLKILKNGLKALSLERQTLHGLGKQRPKTTSGVSRSGSPDVKQALSKQAQDFLISFANGDARQALNLLETTYRLYKKITVNNLKKALQSKHLRYDKKGEEHYNTISAFIKSMRASNTDAALYYLARMVDAGEDPLFIARRMVIFASEDIGMAAPTALVVANEVFRACQTIGYPECAINLAHGTVYLTSAKKDRSSYNAYLKALDDVKKYGNLPIPLNLRNAPTKLMKSLGCGRGYKKYTKASLLPAKLKSHTYFSGK